MLVFRSFRVPKFFYNSIIAIGNFDGFHKGHQEVVKKAKKISKNNKTKVGVLTFEPHPKTYFNKKFDNFRLTPFREKYKVLKDAKVDFMINIRFDKKFLETTAIDFIEEKLVKDLKVLAVVTGFDFVFGNNKVGNVDYMRKYADRTKNFKYYEVPEVKNENNLQISSSNIRQFLRDGKIEYANKLLTRKWTISGKVLEGDKKAREIGFKTANLKINNFCNIKNGVYLVSIKFGRNQNRNYFGIANFGTKPTFNNNNTLLEVHIFNFNREIYNKRIYVSFFKFIRAEKKFETVEKLKDQIIKDINQVKNDKLFKNN